MGLEWSPDSERMKELRKWEKPYRYAPFPKMLYRAQFCPATGRQEASMQRDVLSPDLSRVMISAEQFNTSCQLVVNSEQEMETARGAGWRESPKEALAHQEALENEIAKAAAYRAHEDRNMSETARAEAETADAATADHLPEIPQKRTVRQADPVLLEKRQAAMAKAREAKAAKKAATQGA